MLIPEVAEVIDNRYKLVRPLGQGGFAKVFMAEDIKLGKMVVVKFPDLSQVGDPAVYERFKREIAIGQLLNHPDLPVALSFSEGNPPYIILKYVEGQSLAKIIDEKGQFPVAEVITMVSGLLETLNYCHEQGVYHRDIKPENLLLSTDGRIKIIDFGIAMLEGAPRVTWRGFSGLMGTPEYMSPEQIKGERGGARSDLYSVGCLAYHLLAGRPPFIGDNPLAIMHQHLTLDPQPLTKLRPEISPGVWAAISHSLRRRKEERYASTLEMANDLRAPETVDLKWLHLTDPPFNPMLPDQHMPWKVIVGATLAGVALAVVLVFVYRYNLFFVK